MLDGPGGAGRAHLLQRMLWPKGNPVAPAGPGTPAGTRLAAFATSPGIIPGSWFAMVAAGLALALELLVVLLGRVHIDTGQALAVSAAVILAGVIGARARYVMLQRGKVEGLVVRGLWGAWARRAGASGGGGYLCGPRACCP